MTIGNPASRHALVPSTTPRRAGLRCRRQRQNHPLVAHLCPAPGQPPAAHVLVQQPYLRPFVWLPNELVDGTTRRPAPSDALALLQGPVPDRGTSPWLKAQACDPNFLRERATWVVSQCITGD